MNTVNANNLKIKGVAAIEAALIDEQEVAITVRGEPRFIVVDIDYYQYLRECELENSVRQAKADIAAGQYIKEYAEQHINRMIDKYDLPIDHT
jgi:PHD/YefM family antitoxin component YafN of YafNO toxin-antitoxin module